MNFSFRVTSFNIRYDNPKDGRNSWKERRDIFLKTISQIKPDILALQEVLYNQLCFIRKGLPAYDYVGVGREDGGLRGEFVPIFFKKDVFYKLSDGCFWLSETPDLPGSRGWGAKLPRIVCWVKIALRYSVEDCPIYVFNAHFSHVSEEARVKSAELLVRYVENLGNRGHVILTGDFNAVVGSLPYDILVKAVGYDTGYRVGNKRTGTYHGFTGIPTDRTIDWIIVSGDMELKSFSVCDYNVEGKYPSDHFPVSADLNIKC